MEEKERLNDSIPLEVLIKYLLRERGMDRAYISELEDDIKQLKEQVKNLTLYKNASKVLDKEIRKELKRDEEIIRYKEKIQEAESTIIKLKNLRDSLLNKLYKSENNESK